MIEGVREAYGPRKRRCVDAIERESPGDYDNGGRSSGQVAYPRHSDRRASRGSERGLYDLMDVYAVAYIHASGLRVVAISPLKLSDDGNRLTFR